MDVFYVRDGYGHKIVHPVRLKAIEERLGRALEGEEHLALYQGRA
jgi:[protein-PII] uridylyltransferase